MRILVACEYSGRVRDAFIRKGHDAISCDLLPTESPGPHIQGDVLELLNENWDMIIAFPPCTHLSKAGAPSWARKRETGEQRKAVEFLLSIYNSKTDRIAIENPVGYLSTVWRKPDQIIQPYYFGDPYKKTTCLWLKNIPPLFITNEVRPTHYLHSASHHLRNGRKGKLLAGKARTSKDRSLISVGIANAMAEQWSNL